MWLIHSINQDIKKCSLSRLLFTDCEFMLGRSKYSSLLSSLHIIEISNRVPNASAITLDDEVYLLLFNSSLINFLHRFFANANMLLQPDRIYSFNEGANKEGNNDKYSDLSLTKRIFTDVLNFYTKDQYLNQQSLDYYYQPYQLIEMVEGARRFIVAHELAHIIYKHSEPVDRPESYRAEYQADLLALDMLISAYGGFNSDCSETGSITQANVFNGVRLFFTMLYFVEGIVDPIKRRTHPYPKYRKMKLMYDYLHHKDYKFDQGFWDDFVSFSILLGHFEKRLFQSGFMGDLPFVSLLVSNDNHSMLFKEFLSYITAQDELSNTDNEVKKILHQYHLLF